MKADGNNWFETTTNARGNPAPIGPCCSKCGKFAESGPNTISELVSMKKKSAAAAKKIKEKIDEYNNNVADLSPQ